MNRFIKVLFLGIANAGKSTIISILSKKYSLISNIAPTKSIERHETNVFGYNVINWDIPGQAKYRDELTFNDAKTLESTSILIFTIDVQDIENTSLAIDYFVKIVQAIADQKYERPYIGVFLHKMDPDARKKANVLKNVKRIQDEITAIAIGYTVDYFQTTMFVEATILIGFSSAFRKIISRKEQQGMLSTIKQYADDLILNAVLVLDHNNFIINHFERTSKDLEIIQSFVYLLISSYNNAKTFNLQYNEVKLLLPDVSFTMVPITVNSLEAYLVGSSHDPDVSLVSMKEPLLPSLKAAIK